MKMEKFMEISDYTTWIKSIGRLVPALIVPDKTIDCVRAMMNHMRSLRREIKHIK